MERKQNPKDSLTSTWLNREPSQWSFSEKVMAMLDLRVDLSGIEPPVYPKDAPIPYLSGWQTQRWIWAHALLPVLFHQAFVSLTGRNFAPAFAYLFYGITFQVFALHSTRMWRQLGYRYGFLDGDKRPRDGIPDHATQKVFISLMLVTLMRPVMTTFLTYNANDTPMSPGRNYLYLPLEIGLYGIVLDFWYYWYHRIMHESRLLWKYHRTHHLTKHPNCYLSLYADTEQELFDVIIVPYATWLSLKGFGLPMSFFEWWICHCYILFTEAGGHSGVRVFARAPSTMSWLLNWFDSALIIEDHDIHHRIGWRKSYNYGKQTRLWDRIFGTCCQRYEDKVGDELVHIPIWTTHTVTPENQYEGTLSPEQRKAVAEQQMAQQQAAQQQAPVQG